MGRKYKYVFFDLDHTLWDFEANSNQTLGELVVKYGIDKVEGFVFEEYLEDFHRANFKLWDAFNRDEITTEELRSYRYDHSFAKYQFDKEAIKQCFNEDYIALCPYKGNLMPQAREVLEYLYSEYFNLYILTNGFEHIQLAKLTSSQMFHYFEEVFTARDSGYKKPHPSYFEYVLKTIQADPKDCLMIGDSLEVDVLSAMNLGIDAVWYNPKKEEGKAKPTYEIASLIELKDIVG